LSCVYCSNKSSPQEEEYLSFDKISELLYKFKDLGVFEISLGGGEPLCHPDFSKIVKLAKELGFIILINSNGVYTQEQKDIMVESGIDKIKISIDGIDDKNDILRGKGTFKKAWASLEYLAKHGRNVKVNCTISKTNFDGAFELSKLCNDHGYGLKIAPMYSVGRAKNSKVDPVPLEDVIKLRKDIEKYCKENKINNKTNIASALFGHISKEEGEYNEIHIECCINRIHASINFDGDVFQTGCQTGFSSYTPLGNINNETFENIWEKINKYNDAPKDFVKECVDCNMEKRLDDYFLVTNDFHGEVWENDRTKIIF
jgi:MoaA/NifB/PqqE/SkfB family radical SAM enzyme